MPEYLTTSEFERWARVFDKKLDEIVVLRDDVAENTIAIRVLQDQQTRAKGVNGTISAIVSGIVSAVAVAWSARA